MGTVTITISETTFWSALAAIFLMAWCGVLAAQHLRDTQKPQSERWQIQALGSVAGALAPIWLGLFLFVLYLLGRLVTSIPEASDFEAETLSDGQTIQSLLSFALRWHVLSFVGLLTALGGLITLPLALLRVLTTERQVTATEEGLITDRINKAVEGLGAEKTVKHVIEAPLYEKDPKGDWKRDETGKLIPARRPDGTAFVDRETVETTEPNLEVRIGAIYALERIAQDSDRDHIQIMEILCAYIRQNAPASEAQETLVLKWRRENEAFAEEDRAPFPDQDDIRAVAAGLMRPRADIRVALDVLKRRHPAQITLESQDRRPADKQGYRLDLRQTNLQSADLESGQLNKARLEGAHLEGAMLDRAHLKGADLRWAHLEGAYIQGAHLEGADLHWSHLEASMMDQSNLSRATVDFAHLEHADLYFAQFNDASLRWAHLSMTGLHGAIFNGAKLDRAHLNEAWVSGAKFDAGTSLEAANLRGAAFREVDLSMLHLSQDQVNSLFGDDTTNLPRYVAAPDWHSRTYASEDDFLKAWYDHKKAHNIP